MLQYFIFYKPFEVLSQFSAEGDKKTLSDYLGHLSKDIYPVGRLDYDSEGLLILTNDKPLTHQLLDPMFAHQRTYWVQVEGEITDEAILQLCNGVMININGKQHKTKPAIAKKITAPSLPERNPPIRFRKNIPTSWIALTLTEGKNRQVRRMTAAVGFPTLRLVRYSIGRVNIDGLQSGDCIETNAAIKQKLFSK
ncbi:MAG: pseudouridine synthase [Bacteroidetes bacterium]|nr:pseudouridine synthase [Bacteroidota bacterium]